MKARLERWLARCAALQFPSSDRAVVEGDLLEEAAERARDGLPVRRWLAMQLIRSALPNVDRRLRSRRNLNGRGARGDGGMRMIGRDLRLALRGMRRSPGFAALLTLTLALGIGANTLIYSVVDNVVLNPFPFPEPSRLVGVGPVFPRLNQELSFWESLSPAEYEDIATGSRTLERVVAWDMGNRELSGEGPPERVMTAFWWGDALETLDVRAAAGRGFLPEETTTGARVAILSHRVWQRMFGGDPGLVGRTVSVNGDPHEVVGIMPARTLIYGTDLWTPMPIGPSAYPRGRRQFQVLARIRPAAMMAQVEEDLQQIAGRVERDHVGEFEEYAGWRLVPATWNDVNVRTLRPAAIVLIGAVGFVLLMVCVNVASLALARSTGRRREVAVRSALGAGAGSIARQLLTESMVLATVGAMIGALLAWAGTVAVSAVIPLLNLPIPAEVGLNGRVLGMTALITVAVGLLTGLAPTLQALRSDVQTVLKTDAANMAGGRRHGVQRVFVAVEVTLAFVLLAGGGLLANSFVRLNRADPGFHTTNMLTMRLTLPPQRYDGDRIVPFFQTLRERVEGLPGVVAAGVTTQFPGAVFTRIQFSIEGREQTAEDALPSAYATLIDDAYFATLGLTPLRGRFPQAGESVPRIVINEAAARQFFGATDPVGQRIRLGEGPSLEIVGVAPSVHNAGLERSPAPEMFGPMEVMGGGNNQYFLLVRTTGDPRSVLPAIREVVRGLDPEQPIYAIRTMEETYASALMTRRLTVSALALFALIALTLAAVGISGVVSYAVSERTREIGLRVALGAGTREVRWLVIRQALLPVGLGAAAGLVLALLTGRLLSAQLYGVQPADPATFGGVLLVFAVVALLASYVPARRATRLDPLVALRGD
jgi:putative ABC transport system permease protein